MKVIVFGASGMVGQGVLRECLLARDVGDVLVVGRSAIAAEHPKLRQLVRADLFDYSGDQGLIRGYDACFFCLGTSSSGADEGEFTRINHDLPVAVGKAMAAVNPGMTFVYVSGAGTDSTGHGKVMWARVKGRTENELQQLGFKSVYLFRPGIILPLNGAVSKTRMYRLAYQWFGWAFAILRKRFPTAILDTEQVGQAMLQAVREGAGRRIADSAAIHDLALAGRAYAGSAR